MDTITGVIQEWRNFADVQYISRGGSRGTSNNYVGDQNSNYLLRKNKLKVIFALLHRCLTYVRTLNLPLIRIEYILFKI